MKTVRMLTAFVRPADGYGSRLAAVAAAVVLGLTSSIFVGLPAAAASSARVAALRERLPDAALVHSEMLRDGVKLSRYKLSGDQAKLQRKSWKPDAHEQASSDKHVAAQMRAGRNISSDSVDVIAFELPGKGIFHSVQGKNDVLDDFIVEMQEKGGSFATRFMAAYTDHAEETAGADAGYDQAVGHNLTRRGYGGRTVYFNVGYTYTGPQHWVTHNYEKFQSNGEWQWWAYNAYATFDSADPASGYAASMQEATIRARPWKKNQNGYVNGGPFSYQPKPLEVCTPAATLTINVGTYASLEVPATNCYSAQEIYPNANEHSMGTKWLGSTTAQRYLDMFFNFTIANSPTIPSMSDYIWMETHYCHSWYFDCGWDEQGWSDGGWYV